jgi:hypothetical protein
MERVLGIVEWVSWESNSWKLDEWNGRTQND